jgi:hypothetical protein
MDPEFEELRERLRETKEAAERMAGAIPDQGWATSGHRDETAEDVRALIAIVGALRDLVPDDLRDQVREVLRGLLLLLRAVLDLVVERLAPTPGGAGSGDGRGPDVQDIPIA